MESYPLPNGEVRTSNYFHERNKSYGMSGFHVDVLNFSTICDYTLDGIQVFNLEGWRKKYRIEKYDVLISHAPNLKHHLPFLIKYGRQFEHILFFFHGQEVLKINKVYPAPYSFKKQSKIKKIARNLYDSLKFKVWKEIFPKFSAKADFVFVSNSLQEQFFEGIKIRNKISYDKCHIISNGIGKEFEMVEYDYKIIKEYDFITIRSNMDSSTYCIDILCKLAELNEEFKFLVIGEGDYFKHNSKPQNITLINTTLSHTDLVDALQKSRAALMLTRNDTQGVMSCEIASTGMPLITSDIKVCREIFSCFPNVILVNNDIKKIDLQNVLKQLETGLPYKRIRNYWTENTAGKEIDIIDAMVSS